MDLQKDRNKAGMRKLKNNTYCGMIAASALLPSRDERTQGDYSPSAKNGQQL